jgi:hypothetical protein
LPIPASPTRTAVRGKVLGRVEEPREPSKLLVPADQMPIDDLHGSP